VRPNRPDPAPADHRARRTAARQSVMTLAECSPPARPTSAPPTTRWAPNPDAQYEPTVHDTYDYRCASRRAK
jgi:hypothetical protein